MNLYDKETSLTRHKGGFIVSDLMIPTRRHQAFDELMKFQKEYAASIYNQRDREGRYP